MKKSVLYFKLNNVNEMKMSEIQLYGNMINILCDLINLKVNQLIISNDKNYCKKTIYNASPSIEMFNIPTISSIQYVY
jgi:hypothetical protein